MLPDVGGTEYLVIAAIALIVIGPKDLPKVMRKLGEMVGRMRAMAADFRASFDEMARQSELDDLRREVEAMRAERLDPMQAAVDAFNADSTGVLPAPAPEPQPEPALDAPKPKPRRSAAKPAAKPVGKAARSKAAPPKDTGQPATPRKKRAAKAIVS